MQNNFLKLPAPGPSVIACPPPLKDGHPVKLPVQVPVPSEVPQNLKTMLACGSTSSTLQQQSVTFGQSSQAATVLFVSCPFTALLLAVV